MQNQLPKRDLSSHNVTNANKNPENVSENWLPSASNSMDEDNSMDKDNSIDKDKMDMAIKGW